MARPQPEPPREWFRVVRDGASCIDIDIYGDIGERTDWWTGEKEGVGAKAFLDTLRSARGKAVNLHVNSGGGSVVDAYAMMTAIAEHDGKVTAHVDGLAASAASFLVAAADEVVMSSVAWMMVHNSTLACWGDSAELEARARYLEKIDAQIAGIYARRSGSRGEDEFARAMRETTWFTADEAMEWGLADRVEEAVAAAACFTEDAATWRTAPLAARRALYAGLVAPPSPGAGDTSGSIPRDGGGSAAVSRPVAIGGRLLRLRKRNGELRERGKDA